MMNQGMEMIPISTASTPGGVGGPTTNLNMGMEYWSTSNLASPIPTMQGKMAVNTIGVGLPGSSEHWVQIISWHFHFETEIISFLGLVIMFYHSLYINTRS